MSNLEKYIYINLREHPELIKTAADWFHSKWGVPTKAYLDCMNAYLRKETEYGWYLCLDSDEIIGGMGVIENDFHNRKDLTPNVCAVYTEKDYRCKGIAGHLLNMVVEDMKAKLAENEKLEARARASENGKMKDRMERAKLESELQNIQKLVDRIPPEVLAELKRQQRHTKER